MSLAYDNYLKEHKDNVLKGFEWMKANLPGFSKYNYHLQDHDISKFNEDEYIAYDEYFYGQKNSDSEKAFNIAWLKHIHRNPHHWQYWVLNNDDPDEGEILLEIPYRYIIEMICDWWSFSWKVGNLYEIFNWYDAHKEYIKMNTFSRTIVESILLAIKNKLDEGKK